MQLTVTTDKSIERALADLQEAVQAHRFGVLHIHNLQDTLKNKGFDLPHACYVLDVCNPQQATKVLGEDMGMSVALPCRISIYEEGGKTKISTVKPTALLAALSDAAPLAEVADDVEKTIVSIMESAR